MKTYNILNKKLNSLICRLIFTIIFLLVISNLNAQNNLIQDAKPIEVTLEIVDLNQNLKSFDLKSSLHANKNIADFKYEIQTESFVIPVEKVSSIKKEISAGQIINLNQSFSINKNSSFKIKTIYSGKQFPDSTEFCIVENYYFLFNGEVFEAFKDPREFKNLKS